VKWAWRVRKEEDFPADDRRGMPRRGVSVSPPRSKIVAGRERWRGLTVEWNGGADLNAWCRKRMGRRGMGVGTEAGWSRLEAG